MCKHKLDDFENLKRHHILSDFENVLDALGLVQVVLDELLDGSEGCWDSDFGLLDLVDEVGWIQELFFDEVWQLVPYTSLGWNLDGFQRLPVHMHVQKNTHEKRTHLVGQFAIFYNNLYGIEGVHIL